MSFSSFELLDLSKPIVVFGRDGQVGRALQICLNDLKVPTVFLGRADCDLTSESAIVEVLNRYQPQVIINAAAYTAVDRAEIEQDLAFAINAKAPEWMARYIVNVAHGILVHYSTDYVFADTKKTAYLETDTTGPMEHLSVYGQTKLVGEKAIEEAFNLSQDSRYFTLRTSWVYGDGNNFIRTMLRLASERDELKVVTDQIGVPTSAQWLAEVALKLICSRAASGTYHVVPDGETSWHGLAKFAIAEALFSKQLDSIVAPKILPIPALEYPLPAKRPYNSRLNNTKIKNHLITMGLLENYPVWQDQVAAYIKFDIKNIN